MSWSVVDPCEVELKKIQAIQAAREGAFAALREDGTVVTWGSPEFGGDSSQVQEKLTGVQQIQATECSFAALRADGTIVTWGDSFCGGNSSYVQQLKGATGIQASDSAFAALLDTGRAVVWGHPSCGGAMSSREQEQLLGVREIQSTRLGALAAILEVEILARGEENGILAARGTIRVRYNAKQIFQSLCDPEENKRIFDNCASVNLRNLIQEDVVEKTRTFEVSKTGRWTLLGIPINFESTVVAMEDWKKYEISFKLKKQGAMKHMSGFWRVVPVSQDESIVLFYNEASAPDGQTGNGP
ncbi:unnamed protein product [Effrenium voratum]|nr:unnamed protein product [Effrenium voratum]